MVRFRQSGHNDVLKPNCLSSVSDAQDGGTLPEILPAWLFLLKNLRATADMRHVNKARTQVTDLSKRKVTKIVRASSRPSRCHSKRDGLVLSVSQVQMVRIPKSLYGRPRSSAHKCVINQVTRRGGLERTNGCSVQRERWIDALDAPKVFH